MFSLPLWVWREKKLPSLVPEVQNTESTLPGLCTLSGSSCCLRMFCTNLGYRQGNLNGLTESELQWHKAHCRHTAWLCPYLSPAPRKINLS